MVNIRFGLFKEVRVMNRDLTVGKPSQILWRFCLPLFGSIIFQQLYNIADSLVAGRFIGENALAAVGNGYEITLIFIAFAFGCNIGCSVIVSNFFGARRYNDVKTTVYTTMISSGVLCMILMACGLLFGRSLLRLINTPDEVIDDSLLYLNIYIFGLPFLFFYNVATGIFSAMGDSRTPFIFLAISSTSNIAMDILFVKAFNMGIAGVAWATFLCQSISCILSIIIVLKRLHSLKCNEDERVRIFDIHIFGRIAAKRYSSITITAYTFLFASCGSIFAADIPAAAAPAGGGAGRRAAGRAAGQKGEPSAGGSGHRQIPEGKIRRLSGAHSP